MVDIKERNNQQTKRRIKMKTIQDTLENANYIIENIKSNTVRARKALLKVNDIKASEKDNETKINDIHNVICRLLIGNPKWGRIIFNYIMFDITNEWKYFNALRQDVI
jgi:hypothetical protein